LDSTEGSAGDEILHAEERPLVGPDLFDIEAGGGGQRGKVVEAVLVGIPSACPSLPLVDTRA